jgi:hypothetical protein
MSNGGSEMGAASCLSEERARVEKSHSLQQIDLLRSDLVMHSFL